jgi:hypothetical protein
VDEMSVVRAEGSGFVIEVDFVPGILSFFLHLALIFVLVAAVECASSGRSANVECSRELTQSSGY